MNEILIKGDNLEIETDLRPAAGRERIHVPAGSSDPGRAIQDAINEAWVVWQGAYSFFELDPNVSYPENRGDKEAWARSEGATCPAVVLPPEFMRIARPIYLPACVPLLGAGVGNVFDGTKINFTGAGGLVVLGDMETIIGRALMHGATISGIYFSGKADHLVKLNGSIDNLRITNCHFNAGTSKWSGNCIHGKPSFDGSNPFGTTITEGAHFKDIVIDRNQIEGGRFSIYLDHPHHCDILNNKIYYSGVGIGLRKAERCFVSANRIEECKGYAGLAYVSSGLHLENNSVYGSPYGFWIEGAHDDRLGDHMGTFNGARSHKDLYTLANEKTMGLPIAAAGLEKGMSFISQAA